VHHYFTNSVTGPADCAEAAVRCLMGIWFRVSVAGMLLCCDVAAQTGVGPEPESAPAVEYEVSVEAGGDRDLEAYLLEVSGAYASQSRPPATRTLLRRRVVDDLPVLQKALRSRGYYSARVDEEIDAKKEPVAVVFRIQSGPRYLIDEVHIEVLGDPHGYAAPPPAEIGVEKGQPAAAARVLDAEQKLLALARSSSRALAELGDRRVVVNHQEHGMKVWLRIRPGPPVKLGKVVFSGVETVDQEYLDTLIPWKPGEPFAPKLVYALRQALVDTNLFTTVRVSPAVELDSDGSLPVQVELAEREHRTLKATLGFNTDKGVYLGGGWWNRNFSGRGDQVSVEGFLSGVEIKLGGRYRVPSFRRKDQALVATLDIKGEQTDAYDSTSAGASLGIERTLAEKMKLTLGPAFRFSRVEGADASGSDNFALAYFPVKLEWDFSDDLMDPSRGGRILAVGAPYVDILDPGLNFGKLLGKYSHYLRLREEPRVVLAGKIGLGSIFGGERDRIPADERFYAGGGGSIRGYGYQLASPLGLQGNPIGGNSLVELSAELRWMITDAIGVVGFVDAGGAFTDSIPGSGDDLFVGVGTGLRYATPIGPVRFDVGIPTDRREGVDDPYQLYISVGQAF